MAGVTTCCAYAAHIFVMPVERKFVTSGCMHTMITAQHMTIKGFILLTGCFDEM